MDNVVLKRCELKKRYGSLQSDFVFDLLKGYSVLVGRNNSGKSSILQNIFLNLVSTSEIANNTFVLLHPDRMYISPTMATQGNHLAQYNANLNAAIQGEPTPWNDSIHGPNRSELTRILLDNTSQTHQTLKLDGFLKALGFPPMTIRTGHKPFLDNIEVNKHGSGLRNVLPILAALTDSNIKYILIDEPEISLEPKAQKILRDILVGYSQMENEEEKVIVVATQSNLFLNRENIPNNYLVHKQGEWSNIQQVKDQTELMRLTYDLLGNSTQDLFFPGNFLIVEGSSDQCISQKVADLLEIKSLAVKIFSSGGLVNVEGVKNTLGNALKPLIADYSPYATRIVVLLDKSNTKNAHIHAELKTLLGNRCCDLSEQSLEEYLHEDLYQKANLQKGDVLKRIQSLSSDWKKLGEYKKEVSMKIASVLDASDLEKIEKIKHAVELASQMSN